MRRFLLVFLVLIFCTPVQATTRFLTLTDIHYGANNKSGPGHETGDQLWQTTLAKFRQLSAEVDFIIMLGDIPTHFVYFTSTKMAYESKIFHDLYEANHRKKPIFYVAGNNDSPGGNYHPFAENGRSPLDNARHWQGACAHCDGLIIDDSAMYSGGYYSTYVLPDNQDIILIALNATQFVKQSRWLPSPYPNQHQDAQAQLAWLAKQLEAHPAKQMLIAMHEEPGLDYTSHPVWDETYLRTFIALLNNARNHHQQLSLLTAHTHYDELRKITLDNNTPVFSYAVPSISRSHYNHAAMKIFDINDDFYLSNFTTYYTTKDTEWGESKYQAISTNHSIFPACQGMHLAACLNAFNAEKICDTLQRKHIFGAKNSAVKIANCLNSYSINNPVQ